MNNRSRVTHPKVPIGTIEIQTGQSFEVGERLDAGASGVVHRARRTGEDKYEAAVKFYLIPKQAEFFGTTAQAAWAVQGDEQVYRNERSALIELNHPGIQHVLGWGTVTDASAKFSNEAAFEIPLSNEVQFLVSRYVDGLSIGKWIHELGQEARSGTSPKRHEIRTRIIRALITLVDSLRYLHEVRRYQHSDIRPENIIIERTSEQPILIDFGFAQVFADDLITTTPTTRVRPLRLLNAPPALENEVRDLWTNGTADVSREELRDILFPGLDLYQLGRLFEGFYNDPEFCRLVTPLDCQFLRLLTQDLLTWRTARTLKTSIVHTQLSKLADGYWSGASAPHAPQLAPGHPIRKIALSDRNFLAPPLVKDIIETRSFRRLQQLKQLSLLDFVYPGATQTRLDHSLAVYATTVDLVQFLVRSPRFTKVFDTQSVTELLVCALLHDINHFPFLHYFQELKLAEREEVDLFDFFINEVGTENSKGSRATIAEVLDDGGIDPERIVHLFSTPYGDLLDPRQQITKSVLDSGVDVDKLCYVQGDARFTGVPFGAGVDRQTLLSSADVALQPSGDEHWHLSFEPPALSAVESLLLARYWNFKQIYWHHTNRSLGAMVSYVLRILAEEGHLDLQTYIQATMSFTESAAMAYLDDLHTTKFGSPSILRDLVTRRAGLFKRLLSIKAPPRRTGGWTVDEDRRDKLVESLRTADEKARTLGLKRFADELPKVFPVLRNSAWSADPLILLDIPGRPLDEQMGQVFVTRVQLGGEAGPVVNSPFIETLKDEFLNLSRTVRLYVPASVRETIGKERILDAQVDLEKLLLDSMTPAKERKRGTVR